MLALASGAEVTSASDIGAVIESRKLQLDVDKDGDTKPLTDGLLIIRYLFGFQGQSRRAVGPVRPVGFGDRCQFAIWESTSVGRMMVGLSRANLQALQMRMTTRDDGTADAGNDGSGSGGSTDS